MACSVPAGRTLGTTSRFPGTGKCPDPVQPSCPTSVQFTLVMMIDYNKYMYLPACTCPIKSDLWSIAKVLILTGYKYYVFQVINCIVLFISGVKKAVFDITSLMSKQFTCWGHKSQLKMVSELWAISSVRFIFCRFILAEFADEIMAVINVI